MGTFQLYLGHCGLPQARVFALCTAIAVGPNFAQPVIEPSAELIRQQEREREQRSRLAPGTDVHLATPPPTASGRLPRDETPCFKIDRVHIQTTAPADDPFQWLTEALAGAQQDDAPIGQCLGARGVALLIGRAQDALVARGWITSRVLAPAQNLNSGTLTLTVVPGRVRHVRLAQPEQTRLALWNSAATGPGALLNLRDIEQTLENLKRVPTVEADIQIEPADQPDHSDLVITHRQGLPARLALSADDSGTRATGKYQGSITLSLDNPLSLSDLFYLTLNNDLGGGDPGSRGTRGHVAHYSLPVGYWSMGATVSASRYYQNVAGLNQNYLYRGTTESAEASLSRIVHRDALRKTELRLKAFQRRSNNYIDDTEVMVQRRVVGGWELAVGHKDALGPAKLEGSLSYKRGTGDFDTLPAPEEPFGQGSARFGLLLLDATLTLPFKAAEQALRYSGTLRVQNNTTPLTPQDRFAIGSRYSVRGFDGETTLSAERGWLLRNELGAALGNSGQQAYLGLDYGEVSGPSSELLAGKALAGAVVGLRGNLKQLQYDLFLGTPLHKPDNFKTASTTAGFSLNLAF